MYKIPICHFEPSFKHFGCSHVVFLEQEATAFIQESKVLSHQLTQASVDSKLHPFIIWVQGTDLLALINTYTRISFNKTWAQSVAFNHTAIHDI